MAEETNHNQAGEVAPSVAEENAPSTDSPKATEIPTANAPDPKPAKLVATPPKREKPVAEDGEKPAAAKAAREKPVAEDGEKPAAAKAAREKPVAEDGEKPAAAKAAAKKEKAPALEDKPFAEFMQHDYLPALQKAIAKVGVQDLQLSFAKQKVQVVGFETAEEWWQVIGNLHNGQRHFNLYFPEEDIQGKKVFSCDEGKRTSTLESFLIDERKITLDLMVYGMVQRLNGQKWLGLN